MRSDEELITEIETADNGADPIASLILEGNPEPRVGIKFGTMEGQIWIADDFDDFTDEDARDWFGD